MDETLIEIIPGEHYDIHVTDNTVGLNPGDEPTRMRSCYTKEGYYIGDEKTADFLTNEKGLTQLQPPCPLHRVCSIGYHAPTGKWWGWSHRAIYGFNVGSTVKPGDCGFKPSTVQEWINSVIDWNKDDDIGWGLGRIKSFYWDGPTNTLSIVKHDSDQVTKEELQPGHLGKGTWVAQTEEDAKQMAIDFAESVSTSTTFESVSCSRPVFKPRYGNRLHVNRIKIQLG